MRPRGPNFAEVFGSGGPSNSTQYGAVDRRSGAQFAGKSAAHSQENENTVNWNGLFSGFDYFFFRGGGDFIKVRVLKISLVSPLDKCH